MLGIKVIKRSLLSPSTLDETDCDVKNAWQLLEQTDSSGEESIGG